MFRLVMLGILLLVAGLIYAFKTLPWWQSAGIVAVLILLLPVAGKWLLIKLFTLPFKAKGAVLKGASALVHEVCEVPPPPPSEDSDREEAAQEHGGRIKWLRMDVTVKPKPPSGRFTHWEPGELRLVRPEAKADDTRDDACEIQAVEIFQEGSFCKDEGWKFEGPQRLRLLFRVLPEMKKLKFKYYFEDFGEFAVPIETQVIRA